MEKLQTELGSAEKLGLLSKPQSFCSPSNYNLHFRGKPPTTESLKSNQQSVINSALSPPLFILLFCVHTGHPETADSCSQSRLAAVWIEIGFQSFVFIYKSRFIFFNSWHPTSPEGGNVASTGLWQTQLYWQLFFSGFGSTEPGNGWFFQTGFWINPSK